MQQRRFDVEKANWCGRLKAEAPRIKELERENARLQRRLARVETMLEIQKKASELLGIPLNPIRHIRAIERHGRREWYKLSGYTKRSMVENAVYRYKAIIGPEMRARTLARQRVEHRIGCEILNKMAALGMPDAQRLDRA